MKSEQSNELSTSEKEKKSERYKSKSAVTDTRIFQLELSGSNKVS